MEKQDKLQDQKKETFIKNLIRVNGSSREYAETLWDKTNKETKCAWGFCKHPIEYQSKFCEKHTN